MSKSPLTKSDLQSAVWLRLMQHFNERLAYLRMQNDATQLEEKTENLRGRIAELKDLMALSKQAEMGTTELD